ncbi:lysozyme [Haematospirillum sp. 15-248]|uniref:lysozyme n=1 Tax=Haematospirillum sp. 15-248 TaxID=2723107 RepID=UPI00143B322F|nr:lysozyme [Haematospirillum sp. 15-248]NKD88763.1 lysozyme [Haematospirillum sp. 15-248]
MIPRLPAAVVALVAGGAGAMAIALPYIASHEGTRLSAYQDAARVWTICSGHTRDVAPGQTAAPETCRSLLQADVAESLEAVERFISVPLPESALAALASFCFNVGQEACRKSTAFRKINEGDRAGGCHDLRRWVFVGKKDCRDPANNCRGLVHRREQEVALCLLP